MSYLNNISLTNYPILRGEDFVASDKGRSLKNQGAVNLNLFKKVILLFFLIVNLTSFSQAQESKETRLAHFNLNKNVAIQGYDPVAYFIDKPTKGQSSIQYKYNGVVYYFRTQINKRAFIKTPTKYEPMYGGWCAYAMGLEKADKVSVNPTTYKIIDDKLYLFYNKLGINTLNKWNKDESKYKNKADKNWNNICFN